MQRVDRLARADRRRRSRRCRRAPAARSRSADRRGGRPARASARRAASGARTAAGAARRAARRSPGRRRTRRWRRSRVPSRPRRARPSGWSSRGSSRSRAPPAARRARTPAPSSSCSPRDPVEAAEIEVVAPGLEQARIASRLIRYEAVLRSTSAPASDALAQRVDVARVGPRRGRLAAAVLVRRRPPVPAPVEVEQHHAPTSSRLGEVVDDRRRDRAGGAEDGDRSPVPHPSCARTVTARSWTFRTKR